MKSVSQSPTNTAFVQSPYAFYHHARQFGDLVYWEDYGKVNAFSHEAVNSILRDRNWIREVPPEQYGWTGTHLEDFARVEKFSLLELEPPRHTRIRRLVTRAFTSRGVAELEPFIVQTANNLLDAADTPYELKREFAERLPALTIARLLGVPDQMADQLLDWSHDMVAMYQARRNHDVEVRANQAAKEFASFIVDEIRKQERSPGDNLISRLITVEDEGQKLTRDEMVSTCILLLNAGHEATANSIGNGVKILLECGLDIEWMVSDDCISSTVEEILRFDPPLHIFERFAKHNMTVFGHEFKQGETVALVLAAANRDPAVYADADAFIPDRKPVPHASFGAGIHFCVGAPLARLELEIAFKTLFRRYPRLTLAEEPRYTNMYHFHGLKSLWTQLK